jgi:methyl-accepting chemotaxis protein
MENANLLITFIAITAAAVVIQAGMLIGMYLALRKTSAKLEALAGEVRTKVLPTAELAHNMMSELRTKVETFITNVNESSTIVRQQLERIDASVTDILDRVRLQVIRTDELVTRTLDRVEQTGDIVQKAVVSPVRQFSGLVHGVTTGLEFLFGGRHRRRDGVGVPQDEMFI